jgi:hypothetical protein
MAAPGLADVGAGDPDPLELLRGLEHFPQQLAVGGLLLLALDQGAAGLADALGEAVANRLQLAEIEHPRSGGNRFDAMRNSGAAEGLAEDAGELRLEAADLTAQLKPRPALVDPDPEPGEIVFQQSGHRRNCSQLDSRVAAAIHSASSTAIWGTPLTWTAATATRRVPRSTS